MYVLRRHSGPRDDPVTVAAGTARPIIVGSGLAGLWTAWRLADQGRACSVVSKRGLADSATAWAQGGIAAALGPGDSPALHAADTLAASDGTADPEAVRILTTEGPERIGQLIALGASFDRAPGGRLSFGLEAAHSRPRILHAGGDRTGAMLVNCLVRIVADHPLIAIHEYTEVAALGLAGEDVAGVIVVTADGSIEALEAPAVVLATGGVGQLYAVTTNPLVATADGWALAHRAGVVLRDIDLLQFHPTALKLPGVNPAPLVSEAVRGAGATLVDQTGRRFLAAVHPRGELAPRHVVARAVAAADRAGGAWLDARRVAGFDERFPGLAKTLREHGLDAARDLIPVVPAMHYAMGGIATDLVGRTNRRGLWAVGEVACTGVHGSNRLASNSLLEGVVFADRAARALAAERQSQNRPIPFQPVRESALVGSADTAFEDARTAVRHVMSADVAIERSDLSLQRAARTLAELAQAVPLEAWRTRNQIGVAQLIVHTARRRREVKGSHARVLHSRRFRAAPRARAV